MKRVGLLVCAALALGACDDGPADGSSGPEAPPPHSGPTFHDDIAPLLAAECVSCHREGGAAPFRLDDPEMALQMAEASLASIEAGRMPPWQPDPDCRNFANERILSADQKTLFADWVAQGKIMGQPNPDAVSSPQLAEFQADVVTTPEHPYIADPARPDDYRCFPLDVEFTEDTYVRAADVVPGDAAVVHHVLVYSVPANKIDLMNRLDAEDEGPGYTCYGGSGLGNNGPVVGWVPGMDPDTYPDGVARLLPANSRLVMQVHYNTLAADPAPDLTTVQFRLWDGPQPYVIKSQPQANLAIRIPAGEPESVHVKEFVNRTGEVIEVVGVIPHAHVLAKSIKVEVIREGQEPECVVDVPDWDFNWQQVYQLEPDEVLRVAPGEKFRLTCTYDNSAANQPVVNGEQRMPRDVHWGDGTLDEMCLNFLVTIRPLEEVLASLQTLPECRADCAEPDAFECVADCLGKDEDNAECVLPLFRPGNCAVDCIPQALPAQDCLIGCLTDSLGAGGGLAACMADSCPEVYAPLESCMNDAMAGGACDEVLEACTGS